jgi:predicted alpha/beta-hydrolase family hydrolase
MPEERLTFDVPGSGAVSALLIRPADAWCLYVLAHGAGAPMTHKFMAAMAGAFAAEGIATLRYQFPYMEAGRKYPDREPVLKSTVRAAVDIAAGYGLPLLAGGKSMGGRMTSLAASETPLPSTRGLVFLGFPLHSPAKPGAERGAHLESVTVPMLFLQGARDKLARLDLLEPLLAQIGERATLHVVADADHSFNLPAAAARSADTPGDLARTTAVWARAIRAVD